MHPLRTRQVQREIEYREALRAKRQRIARRALFWAVVVIGAINVYLWTL